MIYSITSSARNRNDSGILRPSVRGGLQVDDELDPEASYSITSSASEQCRIRRDGK
jgi:hypothetical protein